MKLYTSESGPGPRRIQHYLTLKELSGVEPVYLDTRFGETRTEEFLKINPAGRIPVLITDEGIRIYESRAIVQYLEDRFPDPPMAGVTETERRRVELQISFINEFFHACYLTTVSLVPYNSRYMRQCHDIDIVSRPFWWTRLEQVTEAMGSSRFLAGDNPTIADCMLFPMLEYIKPMYGFFIPPHQRSLRAWYDRFLELPGIVELELSDTHHEDYIARYGTRI